MKSDGFTLDLGPLRLVGSLPAWASPVTLDDFYRAFRRVEPGDQPPAATLRFFVSEAELSGWRDAKDAFVTPVWRLCRGTTGSFVVGTAFDPPAPFWVARADPGFRDVQIAHLGGDPRVPPEAIVDPALTVLSRLVLMHHLSRDARGLVVHAAAVADDRRMLLLLGHSGAGKSTLARLFERRSEAHVVNDDRMIVTRDEPSAGWTAWGTPWPGELQIARNERATLGGLVFLQQSDVTRLEPLAPRAALTRLLPLVSVPWYQAELVPPALDLCGKLVREVPAHTLHFRPDQGAVTSVLGLLAG